MHIDVFVSFTKALYHYSVVSPLYSLYMNGPRNMIICFWQGRPASAICSELTGYDEIFWVEHASDCEQLITRNFRSFLVTVECTAYFTLVLFLVYSALQSLRDSCTRRKNQLIFIQSSPSSPPLLLRSPPVPLPLQNGSDTQGCC